VRHIANITIIQHNASTDINGNFSARFNGDGFTVRSTEPIIVSLGLHQQEHQVQEKRENVTPFISFCSRRQVMVKSAKRRLPTWWLSLAVLIMLTSAT